MRTSPSFCCCCTQCHTTEQPIVIGHFVDFACFTVHFCRYLIFELLMRPSLLLVLLLLFSSSSSVLESTSHWSQSFHVALHTLADDLPLNQWDFNNKMVFESLHHMHCNTKHNNSKGNGIDGCHSTIATFN